MYLHFDNNCYFLGDTIWYNAYVIKDYRRTLYWNPNVTTDNFGQASIEFYNNSVCNIIDVSAEGITRYGQFLVNE
ncbi:MAG: hypothetical protein IKH43_06495 [Bacteroidaceae bacterium]|nr:hypothetical protein [Bacteroidaceae bacterium]